LISSPDRFEIFNLLVDFIGSVLEKKKIEKTNNHYIAEIYLNYASVSNTGSSNEFNHNWYSEKCYMYLYLQEDRIGIYATCNLAHNR